MFQNALTRTTHSPFLGFGSREPLASFVDRFLGNGWNDADFVNDSAAPTRTWMPAVDIVETEDAFVATADLPGLKKDDIDISIEDSILTVSGERKFEKLDESATLRRGERAYGTFRRSFTLSRGIDSTKVEAGFEDGVLTLTMPKSELAKSRKIAVG